MIRSLAIVAAVLMVAPSVQAAQARTAKRPPTAYERCLSAPAGQTQAGAIACVDQEIQREDARVGRNYDLVLKDMAQYEEGREPPEQTFATDPVRASQRAWIAFRDADCRVHASSTWGARGALDARKCLLEHATDWADELHQDANPSQEPPSGFVAPSPCERKARTGRDLSVCAIYDLERADARLNRVYKVLLAQLSPGDKETVRAAQRLWIAFRDADCGRLKDDRLWGKSAGYEATLCAVALTSDRAGQLEVFLKSHGLQSQGLKSQGRGASR